MSRGFTLLEVMVAMAILALGLTTILSSQTGLFASTRRVEFETEASSLIRCKMSEIEVDLLQKGFSVLDENESGECCEDEDTNRFHCEWTIETIQLPEPSAFSENEEEGSTSEDSKDPLSAATDLASSMPTGQDGLAQLGSVEDLAGSLAPSSDAQAGGGIIGMALSLVYPSLKPMLEASIRKVKVKVLWNEGQKQRSFEVTQYVTNPLEGSLTPNLAASIDAAQNAGTGTSSSGTTTGASTTTGSLTK